MDGNTMQRLEELRGRIDKIDDELAALFQSRMEVCKDVALLKRNYDIPVLNTDRERQVLNRVMEGLPDELRLFAKQLFSTLFETSKSYQGSLIDAGSAIREEVKAKLRQGRKPFPVSAEVACHGIAGEFSHLASDKLFPIATKTFVRDFEGLINALEKGESSFGVLPIENSFAGSINAVYDLVRSHHFYIVRAIHLPIKYCLLANTGVEFSSIKQVFTHPHALEQCSEFMKSLGNISIISCENTAAAAKLLSETSYPDAACISSEKCAPIYSLSVLKSNVQDNHLNYARYIAISKNFEIYDGAQKISIVVDLPHDPGSLNRLLNKFSAMSINLAKIESRPIASYPFGFSFYIDFEADISDEGVLNLLSEVEKSCNHFTFLGSYDELQ